MARPINPKCLACIALSRAEAQRIHGEKGDGCWNKKRCDRKRSHYANRTENNIKRRGERASAKIAATAEVVAAKIEPPPVAFLILYKPDRKDAHLHAIAIKVWQGSKELAYSEPVHTFGMTNSQVKHYLRQVLSILNEKYGIDKFEPEIIVPPNQCPLEPCPLK